MAVTGPGLDDAMTEKGRHQGDAVILKIASDKKSVILSQVANKTSERDLHRPPSAIVLHRRRRRLNAFSGLPPLKGTRISVDR